MGNNTQKITVSPSIASADQLQLLSELHSAESRGVSDLHIDIEDGNFIPNITFGQKTVRALRGSTDLPFSFHIMATDQLGWLRFASDMNPSIVFGHFEALCYPRAFTALARRLHVRCGLAFNPKTSVADARYLLGEIDGVLLLTVEPDGCGEGFIDGVLCKADEIRRAAPGIEIWADGNITDDRLELLEKHGFTNAVMGRAFFAKEK
ncbi:MAG: hypothetical protein VB021_02320 [Oscillospiraceae bacterium]|nr:hypothetical protein [Oscillospiraceae bacterium]